MTLQQLLADLVKTFQKFEDPQLEARHLLLEALRIDLNALVLRGEALVSAEDLTKIQEWRDARLHGEPLAYLAGHKSFYKYDFKVRPGVLIPRPATEFVVEVALARRPNCQQLVDLGCGSGCIGLSLLKEWSAARLTAVDSSVVAIAVSQENAALLGVSDRAEIVESPVENWHSSKTFDLIVANPPYIAVGDERVQPEVHQFEPHEALYAADEGLAALRLWIRKSWDLARPGGALVIEIGSGQSLRVQEIMTKQGFQDLLVTKDLDGIERVISGIKPE